MFLSRENSLGGDYSDSLTFSSEPLIFTRSGKLEKNTARVAVGLFFEATRKEKNRLKTNGHF